MVLLLEQQRLEATGLQMVSAFVKRVAVVEVVGLVAPVVLLVGEDDLLLDVLAGADMPRWRVQCLLTLIIIVVCSGGLLKH